MGIRVPCHLDTQIQFMQQIERVGAIALLLLVVTMATVALWGDGQGGADSGRQDLVARTDSSRGSGQSTPPWTRGQRQQLPVAPSDERSLPARGPANLGSGHPSRRESGGESGSQSGRGPQAQFASSSNRDAEARTFAQAQQRTAGDFSGSRKHKNPGRLTPSGRNAGAAPSAGHRYTVRSGDCLERIARDQCGDRGQLKRIMAMNGIHDPNRIRVGQVLQLPGEGRSGSSTSPGQAPARASNQVYVVQAGDNLSTISQRTLGTFKRWKEFLEINRGLDPDRLQVGARLKVPAGAIADQPVLLANARVNR